MADGLPLIWEGAAHTFAKHKILEAYLNAWLPIMSRQSQRIDVPKKEILFVDGFAGPGSYAEGQDGSPILAIKSVLSHTHEFGVPVSFLFIEKIPERFILLEEAVKKLRSQTDKSSRIKHIHTEQGDCETILNKYIDASENSGKQFGPAFIFLDQFGYSDIAMKLVQRIMQQPVCEVLLYLNWGHMNRFLTDETKWSSITAAFGGEEWRKVLTLEIAEKAKFMQKTYKDALVKKGGCKYVWCFAICDSSDKLLYWLFFCTNNLRGLEEMKKAMWKVDPTGGFRFSDKDDPSQLNMFTDYKDEELAEELASTLAGKKCTVAEIEKFVLTETPAYKYKNALSLLEKNDRLKIVSAPPKRRKGTFPDETMTVLFVSKSCI